MAIEIIRDEDKDLTMHVVGGMVSEKEMYEVLENFYSRGPTTLLLWDMSQAQVSHVTASILEAFVRRAVYLGSHQCKAGRTQVKG